MKKNKTLRLLLLILILIIAFLTVRSTYSKYVTENESSSKMNISKWNIKLYDEDIKNKSDFSEDIKVTFQENENTAEGVIVPTSKGTCELVLESTGTELPFEYEIRFSDPKPYNFIVNNITPGSGTSSYLYDISLYITNENPTIDSWSLNFTVPENLIATGCSFTGIDNYSITDNAITITSDTIFTNKETKTINMVLAFVNNIDIDINNVTLNGTNLDISTDRISDFRVTSYTLNGGEEIFLHTSETSITGVVTPADNSLEEVINHFTFTVEWYDEADNILDNYKDVEAYQQNLPATLPVTLTVTQILD